MYSFVRAKQMADLRDSLGSSLMVPLKTIQKLMVYKLENKQVNESQAIVPIIMAIRN